VAPYHLRKKGLAFSVVPTSFPFRYKTWSRSPYKGEDPVRHPMCPLGSRARYAEASLGGYLAGTVLGAAKVEEPAEDPDRERELQGCGPRRELATARGDRSPYPAATRREC
jgi:hypothetical protein